MADGGIVVIAVLVLPLLVITVRGAHRRGLPVPAAVVAGLFFPVTWTIWYFRDEHPYRPGTRSY